MPSVSSGRLVIDFQLDGAALEEQQRIQRAGEELIGLLAERQVATYFLRGRFQSKGLIDHVAERCVVRRGNTTHVSDRSPTRVDPRANRDCRPQFELRL